MYNTGCPPFHPQESRFSRAWKTPESRGFRMPRPHPSTGAHGMAGLRHPIRLWNARRACRGVSRGRVAIPWTGGRLPGCSSHPRRRADHRRAADRPLPERHDEPRDPAAHRVRHRLVRRGRTRARGDLDRPGDRRPGHEPLDGRLGHAARARPPRSRSARAAITTLALVEVPLPVYMALGLVDRPVHAARSSRPRARSIRSW